MDFTNNMEKYMCVIDRLVKTGRKQPVRGSCWGCNVGDSSQTLDLHTLVTVAVTAASSESHKDFPAKAHSLAEHHHGREAVHPPARPPAQHFNILLHFWTKLQTSTPIRKWSTPVSLSLCIFYHACIILYFVFKKISLTTFCSLKQRHLNL